jgi:hypothetical protein
MSMNSTLLAGGRIRSTLRWPAVICDLQKLENRQAAGLRDPHHGFKESGGCFLWAAAAMEFSHRFLFLSLQDLIELNFNPRTNTPRLRG